MKIKVVKGGQSMRNRADIERVARKVRKSLRGAGKTTIAGVAAAFLLAGNLIGSLREQASKTTTNIKRTFNKPEEDTGMKKSTFAAILIALAAVAGVLGALYVYVLRREKELDEYEQLLFSEDFSEDILPDETVFAPEEEEV